MKSRRLSYRQIVRAVPLIIAATLPGAMQAQEASATAIDLKFRPPEIPPETICVGREPDAETTAMWADWDQGALPDISPNLIKRDIRRLQQIDPVQWLGTIEVMIDRLVEVDPSFAGTNALVARIAAMEAAGDFAGLRDRQLVVQLANEADNLSPRLKNVLSQLIRDGIGIERDIEQANALLVEAGYAGNANALLTLSQMVVDGEAPEGWDVPVELAVTLAFGSLVGELNETICDRTTQIAREYHNGDIVQADEQLAHDWFRFTADLGDANAAWKVVEYHMLAEAFDKDNDVLLRYLRQASDAGLPYAQIELGRVYETGALVERDLDQTYALFQAAAASGQRAGLTRIALFLETYEDLYPNSQAERIAAMRALAELDDAPGWVFTRLAQLEIAERGRWAAQTDAKALFERAAELGDTEGIAELAEILLSERDPASFERAVDLMSKTIPTLGVMSPNNNLYSAFMCQAADAPILAQAAHWRQQEARSAATTLELTAQEVISLNAEENPLTVATLQSQALYGRPTSLARYLKFLDESPDSTPELRAFWADYSDQFPEVLRALAKLEFELAENPQQREVAFDLLHREYQRVGADAALELAQALLDYQSDTAVGQEQVKALLQDPARAGQGAAIKLIASLEADDPTGAQTYATYADAIAANGDFDALVFAIPHVTRAEQSVYFARAISIMQCDYKNVMELANVSRAIGDTAQETRWVRIAEGLIGNSAWAMVDLAERHIEMGTPEGFENGINLFEAALAQGDQAAARGLFTLFIDPETPAYDPDRAATLLQDAMVGTAQTMLPSYLGRYRGADADTQAVIAAQVDIPAAHLLAANSGDVFAMRIYAMHLRETATNAADVTESTRWLSQAAEGGETTAMAEFGYALAFGIGTPVDPDNARLWLERAAEAGSEKAQAITSLMRLQDGT